MLAREQEQDSMGRHGTHGYTPAFLASRRPSFQTKIFLSYWALGSGSPDLKVFKFSMINQYFIIHSDRFFKVHTVGPLFGYKI